MTLTKSKENLESNIENLFTRLSKGEHQNRRLIECLRLICATIEIHGVNGIELAVRQIKKALEENNV
jgi:hypothetical protein